MSLEGRPWWSANAGLQAILRLDPNVISAQGTRLEIFGQRSTRYAKEKAGSRCPQMAGTHSEHVVRFAPARKISMSGLSCHTACRYLIDSK